MPTMKSQTPTKDGHKHLAHIEHQTSFQRPVLCTMPVQKHKYYSASGWSALQLGKTKRGLFFFHTLPDMAHTPQPLHWFEHSLMLKVKASCPQENETHSRQYSTELLPTNSQNADKIRTGSDTYNDHAASDPYVN
jgi:hypothetical protein